MTGGPSEIFDRLDAMTGDPFDGGVYRPDFTSEAHLRDWLAGRFREGGWSAETEVTSECDSCRADVLARCRDFVLGVETKLLSSERAGGAIGRAVQQISRYSDAEFPGRGVDAWCLAPHYSGVREGRSGQRFAREFVNSFGLGYIEPHGSKVMVDFVYADSDLKLLIHTSDGYGDYDMDYGDYDRIREWVRQDSWPQ